ncbi:hypothetical protein K504DRAFT_365794 [Pleomassaria siparia CBS 279.74]|uniref:Proteophosphoglycan 5 n=1 Tax=Pleomassaria siparia CBS 279.74 TaxID=1314801 RepID=A0A6G1KR99_9PLEO|nr:hypothetical protein K504DRAFT_365794 [Pleomassaria siparia CBS 279.74]
MSTTQNLASPRAPRPKHQHSKSATGAPPNNNGKQPQRRQRGPRPPNGHHANAQQSAGRAPAYPLDQGCNDSAVLSSEEVQMPTGPRNMKKHTQSQPSTDRVFSPTTLANGSLTDSELGPNNISATPVKPQGAYAGPTFHASPAPSALPIPKFLSRSVPAKTRDRPPTPPEESSDSSSSPVPSPSRAPIAVPSRHQDSPLDMLFKADRAERARNANRSPTSSSSPPSQVSPNERLHYSKQDSYNSMNAVFPIELDADAAKPRPSLPVNAPVAHRSVTAPSKIPQAESYAKTATESAAVQDLLDRLSFSQKKPTSSTPPRTTDRPEASSRMHTPSPFRTASNPTTPLPATKESSEFFYGNRNLSPLFKAAKTDSAKRNSGLRTEITANSPILPQGGFPALQGPIRLDPNAVGRNYLDNVLGGPTSPRNGSVPYIQSYREPPNNRKARTPNNRRAYHASHNNGNGNANSRPVDPSKPATTPFSFVPSSVSAKQHSTAKPSDTKLFDTNPSDSTASLEQDLKRMLNLKLNGDQKSVR